MARARTDAPMQADELRKIVMYNPETGVFTWKVKVGKRYAVGGIAGSLMMNGYWTICIRGRSMLAHRLSWLYMTGSWPAIDIDHIDGVRENNAWVNLREADRRTNAENKRREQPANKTTGVLGTCFHKGAGKFSAQIKVHGKKRHLGLFNTVDEAFNAYVSAKRQLHAGCTI